MGGWVGWVDRHMGGSVERVVVDRHVGGSVERVGGWDGWMGTWVVDRHVGGSVERVGGCMHG